MAMLARVCRSLGVGRKGTGATRLCCECSVISWFDASRASSPMSVSVNVTGEPHYFLCNNDLRLSRVQVPGGSACGRARRRARRAGAARLAGRQLLVGVALVGLVLVHQQRRQPQPQARRWCGTPLCLERSSAGTCHA